MPLCKLICHSITLVHVCLGCRAFARDVRFVWGNAKLFNKPTSYVWRAADTLSAYFERLYSEWVVEVSANSLRPLEATHD